MQETKSGFTIIMQKPNSNYFCGKAHHCHVHKKQKKKARWNIKRVLVTYFDWEMDSNHQELVPPGQTIDHHYYWEGLQCVWWQASWKHLMRWQNKDWLISMTMCWHTMSELQYLGCKKYDCGQPPSLFVWLDSVWLLLFLWMKSQPSSAARSGTNCKEWH